MFTDSFYYLLSHLLLCWHNDSDDQNVSNHRPIHKNILLQSCTVACKSAIIRKLMNTQRSILIYLWVCSDKNFLIYKKISLLKHMNEDVVINMKKCCHICIQENKLSYWSAIHFHYYWKLKERWKHKWCFLISMNLMNINGNTVCKRVSFLDWVYAILG